MDEELEAYEEVDESVDEDIDAEEVGEEVVEEISSKPRIVEPGTLSDEELDEIADTAIDILQSIFSYFETGSLTIDEYEGDEGELILDITGEDLAILIGRHGKTLEALQYIVSAISYRKLGFRYPVIVDVEGYKSRLRDKLESIAHSSASRAVKQHRNVHLRPMSPYERRIVHMALKDDRRVETESDGQGVDRHVVIYPV